MGFSLHFEKNDALFLVRPGWHSISSKHLPWGTPENSLSGCGTRFSKSWHSYISVVPSKTIPDTRQCPDQNRQSQYPYSDRNSAAHTFMSCISSPLRHLLVFTSFHEKKKIHFPSQMKKNVWKNTSIIFPVYVVGFSTPPRAPSWMFISLRV